MTEPVPTYYVRHPDGSYSAADPQPVVDWARIKQTEAQLEQACYALNDAHDKLMVAQGVDRAKAREHDWPVWSGPAHVIRAAEKTLNRRLAKTDEWTEFPSRDVWTEAGV